MGFSAEGLNAGIDVRQRLAQTAELGAADLQGFLVMAGRCRLRFHVGGVDPVGA